MVFCLSMCFACTEMGDEINDDNLKSGHLGSDKDGDVKMVTKPFKAHFYTKRDYSLEPGGTPPPVCEDVAFQNFNYQVGEGEATHLGHFTTKMHFCGKSGTGLYNYINGAFVAANGDSLFIGSDGVGEVKFYSPGEGEPPYDAYFEDPFIFTGGTGRFEGASGGGTTDSKVDLFGDDGFIPEHRTDHIWTGTLILPKK